MPNIVILLSSVRVKRNSNRVATYLKKYTEENKLAEVEILDLDQYQFPIFTERLKFQTDPDKKTIEFAEKIKNSQGVIIVTPEYNGGYPAALKNVIDLLNDEWHHKPIAISTVSAGAFGGSQAITSLQFTLWKMTALIVPATFPVPKVQDAFDENGTPTDKTATDKRAAAFLKELLWCIQANEKMKNG